MSVLSKNSVRTGPGQSACTRTPVSRNSSATISLKALMNALVAAYTARGSDGPARPALNASPEERLITAPRPRRTMPDSAARLSHQGGEVEP